MDLFPLVEYNLLLTVNSISFERFLQSYDPPPEKERRFWNVVKVCFNVKRVLFEVYLQKQMVWLANGKILVTSD